MVPEKMERVTLDLGERSYHVLIGSGLLGRVGEFLKGEKAFLLTDPVVDELYYEQVGRSIEGSGIALAKFIVPEGERSKNLSQVTKIYDSLLSMGAERSTTLLTLGGGVIGDLGGFSAATFLRGIPYIQIPTTLLAQVDSSVGGKTGVNHPKGKNLVGAFYQPEVVLIDTDTLKTLPEDEFLSGLAEVIKYGVISETFLFDYLEENREDILERKQDVLTEIIKTSVKIKADVVSKDERESGIRSILNFGHTMGHAIERLSGYGAIKHGEAVARGMAVSIEISRKLGLLSMDESERITKLLKNYGFDLTLPPFSKDEYKEAINYDKKVTASHINYILTQGIGHVTIKKMTISDILNILWGGGY